MLLKDRWFVIDIALKNKHLPYTIPHSSSERELRCERRYVLRDRPNVEAVVSSKEDKL